MAKRPQWAEKLSKSTWEGLKSCQNKKTPSLAQLKTDLAYQARLGMKCWSCLDAQRELGLELPQEIERVSN